MAVNNCVNVSIPLSVANGGTAVNTETNHGLLLGNSTTSVAALSAATNGQIPIGNSGNNPTIAAFSSSDSSVSVTNGAGSISLSSSLYDFGVTLIQSQSASTSATIDFTSGITGYSYYILNITRMVPGTSLSNLQLLFSTDGGSTWASTNYAYCLCAANAAGTNRGAVSNSDSSIQLMNTVLAGSTFTSAGQFFLFNLGSSSVYKQVFGASCWVDNSVSTFGSVGASWNDSTAVNGIRLKMASGNINSGTFQLSGVL